MDRRIARSWDAASFWDEVELEIDAPDGYEFAEFLDAEQLAIEPRSGFRADLEAALIGLGGLRILR